MVIKRMFVHMIRGMFKTYVDCCFTKCLSELKEVIHKHISMYFCYLCLIENNDFLLMPSCIHVASNSSLGLWSGNFFLIAPFPDLCLLVPFYD